jgi:hypothetical protein
VRGTDPRASRARGWPPADAAAAPASDPRVPGVEDLGPTAADLLLARLRPVAPFPVPGLFRERGLRGDIHLRIGIGPLVGRIARFRIRRPNGRRAPSQAIEAGSQRVPRRVGRIQRATLLDRDEAVVEHAVDHRMRMTAVEQGVLGDQLGEREVVRGIGLGVSSQLLNAFTNQDVGISRVQPRVPRGPAVAHGRQTGETGPQHEQHGDGRRVGSRRASASAPAPGEHLVARVLPAEAPRQQCDGAQQQPAERLHGLRRPFPAERTGGRTAVGDERPEGGPEPGPVAGADVVTTGLLGNGLQARPVQPGHLLRALAERRRGARSGAHDQQLDRTAPEWRRKHGLVGPLGGVALADRDQQEPPSFGTRFEEVRREPQGAPQVRALRQEVPRGQTREEAPGRGVVRAHRSENVRVAGEGDEGRLGPVQSVERVQGDGPAPLETRRQDVRGEHRLGVLHHDHDLGPGQGRGGGLWRLPLGPARREHDQRDGTPEAPARRRHAVSAGQDPEVRGTSQTGPEHRRRRCTRRSGTAAPVPRPQPRGHQSDEEQERPHDHAGDSAAGAPGRVRGRCSSSRTSPVSTGSR